MRRTRRKTRRTELTVETAEVLIARSVPRTRAWCAACGREVEVVSVRVADLLQAAGVSLGGHRFDVDGDKVVCVNSLGRGPEARTAENA